MTRARFTSQVHAAVAGNVEHVGGSAEPSGQQVPRLGTGGEGLGGRGAGCVWRV